MGRNVLGRIALHAAMTQGDSWCGCCSQAARSTTLMFKYREQVDVKGRIVQI